MGKAVVKYHSADEAEDVESPPRAKRSSGRKSAAAATPAPKAGPKSSKIKGVVKSGRKSAKKAAAKKGGKRAAVKEEEDEIQFEVDKILGVKLGKGNVKEYSVLWKGYKNPTWEPSKNMAGSIILVTKFVESLQKNII